MAHSKELGAEPHKHAGRRLAKARERAGLTQEDAAAQLGVHAMTVSRWEREPDLRMRSDVLTKLAALYGTTVNALLGLGEDERVSTDVSRGTTDDEWSPNPALAKELPPRAYEVAVGYLRRLERAGLESDQIDEAERLMLDSRYSKLNKRTRELTESEHIELLDATWEIIREVLGWQGIRP